MHNPHDPHVLPMRDGVSPSCVVLPSVGQGLILDFLAQRLSVVSRQEWAERMLAGLVVDERKQPVTPQRPFERGLRLYYYRALPAETVIPFEETIVYQDAHLLIADKPHFLPVVPSGSYLQETLLVRLKKRTGNEALSPLHRIDRETAGLVMFSVQRETRGAYQALFRERRIDKTYEAIAPWTGEPPPARYESRIEESPQFFRMHEVAGSPNALTQIEVMAVQGGWARYLLRPVSGKRHQLRVHMAALGRPLRNDAFYPEVNDAPPGDYSRPLQLLARSVRFLDPLHGREVQFVSQRTLEALDET